jgi:nucleotidyltransferase substrate binding protein (TIGR01987 family)
MLDFSSLQNALNSLDKALAEPINEFVRDAAIQRFEYCYELCWKMLRRVLAEDQGTEAISALSRRDLFRLAAQKHLIDDPLIWFEFHKARNETSHTYNETKALEVYHTALTFAVAAKRLMNALVKY